VVLDRLYVLWQDDNGTIVLDPQVGATKLARFDTGDKSLLLFYVLLMGWLDTYQPPRLDLASYLNALGWTFTWTAYPLD